MNFYYVLFKDDSTPWLFMGGEESNYAHSAQIAKDTIFFVHDELVLPCKIATGGRAKLVTGVDLNMY